MSNKRGLGRGLGALIPDFEESTLDAVPIDEKGRILQLHPADIKLNPLQPRKKFSDETIAELAASIKEQGILQPLLVSRDGSDYVLIAGERRLRAAHKAGLTNIPVIVKDVDERSIREIALIENIQREDLNVLEEAVAYQGLIERFEYTQEEVAEKVGKSRAAVTNSLRLLKLTQRVKNDLIDNKITMGHARAYLSLERAAQQEEVHRSVIKKGFSVRQTENLIKKLKTEASQKDKPQKSQTADNKYDFVVENLQKRFATKVKVANKGDKGKLIIEFYSAQEFERIYDLLRG